MTKQYVEQRQGTYYVADTRISLDSLIHAFHRGESPESIRQYFELLTLEEVYGALTFYLANQNELDAYLARQDEHRAEAKRNAPPLPADLQNRLNAMRREMRSPRPA
jgi:uncharacterized protein (DUF433 family)